MTSLLYVVVGVIFLGFFMSVSRLLSCLVVVENFGALVIMLSSLLQSGVLCIALIVLFTIESALGLVVLFRVWDSSSLMDVVGR